MNLQGMKSKMTSGSHELPSMKSYLINHESEDCKLGVGNERTSLCNVQIRVARAPEVRGRGGA